MKETSPLRAFTYTLTTADALAYECLPREMRGWRKWLLLLWLAGMGGLVAFLPVEWVGPEGGWMFWVAGALLVGLGWLIATAIMTTATRRRARRRTPVAQVVTLEQWGDHLAVTVDGRQSFVAWETIAAVTLGKTHVFIDAPPQVIIVPLRAFDDSAAMSAFADDIDRLSQESAD